MPTRQKILISLVCFVSVLFLVSASVFAATSGKLVFAATVIRHGDREPYYQLKKVDPQVVWDWGIGNLTPTGMSQEVVTGTFLNKRFINTDQLISTTYKPHEVYIYSGECDRVLQSVNSLFMGLYPPGSGPFGPKGNYALPNGIQIPAIYTMPRNEDKIINNNVVDSTEANNLFKAYSYNLPEWIALTDQYSGEFAYLSATFGQTITSIADLIPIGDNLNVRTINKKIIPTLPSGITAQDLANLSKEGEMLQYQPKQVGVFLAGDLLKKIAGMMKNAASGKEQSKYAIFSAHDSNLLALMSAIKDPCIFTAATKTAPADLSQYPSYAGFINLELYDNDGTYTVHINYYANEDQYPNYNIKTCKLVKSDSFTLTKFSSMFDKKV